MPGPKVVFLRDEALDVEIVDSFIDEKIGDVDFGQERIVALHPELAVWRGRPGRERKEAMQRFVYDFYERHNEEFEENVVKANKIWRGVEQQYFHELENIFGALDFYPHDVIQGKLSAFACAVIEDDGRSFQVLYSLPSVSPEEFIRGVAHEVLHFISDAYLAKYGFNDLLDDWDFREVLPVIILNLPAFLALTKRPESGYPQHKGEFLRSYQAMWSASKDFFTFLQKVRKAKREKKG